VGQTLAHPNSKHVRFGRRGSPFVVRDALIKANLSAIIRYLIDRKHPEDIYSVLLLFGWMIVNRLHFGH